MTIRHLTQAILTDPLGERAPVGTRMASAIPENWLMCKSKRFLSVPGLPDGQHIQKVLERPDGDVAEAQWFGLSSAPLITSSSEIPVFWENLRMSVVK